MSQQSNQYINQKIKKQIEVPAEPIRPDEEILWEGKSSSFIPAKIFVPIFIILFVVSIITIFLELLTTSLYLILLLTCFGIAFALGAANEGYYLVTSKRVLKRSKNKQFFTETNWSLSQVLDIRLKGSFTTLASPNSNVPARLLPRKNQIELYNSLLKVWQQKRSVTTPEEVKFLSHLYNPPIGRWILYSVFLGIALYFSTNGTRILFPNLSTTSPLLGLGVRVLTWIPLVLFLSRPEVPALLLGKDYLTVNPFRVNPRYHWITIPVMIISGLPLIILGWN